MLDLSLLIIGSLALIKDSLKLLLQPFLLGYSLATCWILISLALVCLLVLSCLPLLLILPSRRLMSTSTPLLLIMSKSTQQTLQNIWQSSPTHTLQFLSTHLLQLALTPVPGSFAPSHLSRARSQLLGPWTERSQQCLTGDTIDDFSEILTLSLAQTAPRNTYVALTGSGLSLQQSNSSMLTSFTRCILRERPLTNLFIVVPTQDHYLLVHVCFSSRLITIYDSAPIPSLSSSFIPQLCSLLLF